MATYTTYVDPNSTAGGTGLTSALTGTDRAYASLAEWESVEGGKAYVSGDIVVAICMRQGAAIDTTPVVIGGWVAGVIGKITVDANYKHEGKWADVRSDNGNYIYQLFADNSTLYALDLTAGDYSVKDLLVSRPNDSSSSIYCITNGTGVVENLIVKGFSLASTGIRSYSTGIVRNCIVYGGFSVGIDTNSYDSRLQPLYNNTVYGCTTGISYRGEESVKNNLVLDCTTCFVINNSGGVQDYNVSSDATATGANSAINQTNYTSYFVDAANGDFHLLDSSLNLFGVAGADLSSIFTTDIDGDVRASAGFGVGADFFISGGSFVVQTSWNIQAQQAYNIAWNLLTSVDYTTSWNIINTLLTVTSWNIKTSNVSESAWNILVSLESNTAWNLLTSSEQQIAWNILTDLLTDTAWNIITGDKILKIAQRMIYNFDTTRRSYSLDTTRRILK